MSIGNIKSIDGGIPEVLAMPNQQRSGSYGKQPNSYLKASNLPGVNNVDNLINQLSTS
jgi:hypothetical protein